MTAFGSQFDRSKKRMTKWLKNYQITLLRYGEGEEKGDISKPEFTTALVSDSHSSINAMPAIMEYYLLTIQWIVTHMKDKNVKREVEGMDRE